MPKWFKIKPKFRVLVETVKNPPKYSRLEAILNQYGRVNKILLVALTICENNRQKRFVLKGTIRKDQTVVFTRISHKISEKALKFVKNAFKTANQEILAKRKAMKLEIIRELLKYGYEIEYDQKRKKWLAWRKQYLDNGYGFYFYADIDLEISQNGKITEIKVDGLKLSEIEKEIEKTISECPIMQKYDECIESLHWETREKIENEIDTDLCQTCTYYSMIRNLAEMLEDKNW